ncbi:MAG: ribokinase [Clostridium argentinense]|uniref:Ribokinase n=1 Tax=Clostridium faecium TaxID=2762223 RepID=A0ABR8YSR6_9CLOT|nr:MULTISPECIES: ribokinase [Clostridium]MBD8047283.1 ribokinase [Clostridium faecium]MBS5824551.1 ribokinase [Clostridium argentinense]MDU1349138.1 ribokinase [Clostridium argentinense]
MKDILVIGSINMDFVVDVDHIPKLGETILSNSISKFYGGKGANQAVAIGRLGERVKMIGKVGQDDNGKDLIKSLKESNVDVKYILFDEHYPSGTAFIYVDKNGDNCIVVNPASNSNLKAEDIEKYSEAFENVSYCVMQLEIPLDTVRTAIDFCHKKDIKIILNPAPAQEIPEKILRKVDYLIPNETELELITGVSIDNEIDIKNAVNKVLAMGVKNVITTLGEKGAVYATNTEFKTFDSIKVKAVDTTAAGDSFIGGFVSYLNRENDVIKAIEHSLYVGALTVSKKGAQSSLPYKEEVEEFINIKKSELF